MLASATPFSAAEERGISIVSTKGEKITQYGESHALLIGNSDYHGFWPDLPSIQDELDGVEKALKAQGFEVSRLKNLNAKQLENAYENFIKSHGYRKDNRILIFYSGHGHTRGAGNKGYLVPVDSPDPERDEERFLQGALSMTRVLSLAREMEANHSMFLFDSCFSGSIFKSRALPSRTGYINELTAKPVRQFITSGSAGETVPAHSVFTPAFVDALEYGLGDLNRDGFVTGTELGLFLQETVSEFIPQTPQFGKINDYDLSRGDFVFSLRTIDKQDATKHSMSEFLSQLEEKSNVSEPILSPAASGKLRLMEKAHADIVDYELQLSPGYEQRHKAWSYFLTLYDANIPGSDVDNRLIASAQGAVQKLDTAMKRLQEMQGYFKKSQDMATATSLENQRNIWQDYLKRFPKGPDNSTLDDELRDTASQRLRLVVDELNWTSKTKIMAKEHAKLENSNDSFEGSPDQGIKAWSQFLASYGTDNPFSMKDDLMRNDARHNLEKLQANRSIDDAISKMSAAYVAAINIDDSAIDKKIGAHEFFLNTFTKNIAKTNEDEDMRDNVRAALDSLLAAKNDAHALLDMQTAFNQMRESQMPDDGVLENFLETFGEDVASSEDDESMRAWTRDQRDSLRQQHAQAKMHTQQTNDLERPEKLDKATPRATIESRMEQIMLANLLIVEDLQVKFMVIGKNDGASFEEGMQLLARGSFEKALIAFNLAVAEKPKKNTFEFRGYTHAKLGNHDAAIADLSASMGYYTTRSTLLNRARLYIEVGDMDSAISDLTTALESGPIVRAYNNRAVAYAIKGDLEAAERDLTAAVTENRHYETALNNRGLVYEARGESDLALVDFEKVLTIDSDHREAISNLKHLKLAMNKP